MMTKPKKFGFYHKSKNSNKQLIKLFERNQKVRNVLGFKDWQDEKNRNLVKNLIQEEKQARKEILKILKKREVKTGDDFYRAAWFFHHGSNFRSYALAVAFAAASYHLGEPWGKNFYAVALDRFLLSIGQPQYFGTQYEKKYGKWIISPYNKKTTNKERKEYNTEPLDKALEGIKKFELIEKAEK